MDASKFSSCHPQVAWRYILCARCRELLPRQCVNVCRLLLLFFYCIYNIFFRHLQDTDFFMLHISFCSCPFFSSDVVRRCSQSFARAISILSSTDNREILFFVESLTAQYEKNEWSTHTTVCNECGFLFHVLRCPSSARLLLLVQRKVFLFHTFFLRCPNNLREFFFLSCRFYTVRTILYVASVRFNYSFFFFKLSEASALEHSATNWMDGIFSDLIK